MVHNEASVMFVAFLMLTVFGWKFIKMVANDIKRAKR